MKPVVLLEWLSYAQLVAMLVLLVRLVQLKLYKSYRWFFAYVLYDVVESIFSLMPIDQRYILLRYIGARSIKLIFAMLVVGEMYGLVLAERKALAAFAKKIVAGTLALATVAALAGLYLSKGMERRFLARQFTFIIEGTLESAILVFLLLMAGFLAWFPVRIRRNLFRYITGFVVYYAARASGIFAAMKLRLPRYVEWINVAVYTVILVSISFWIWSMRKSGEEDTTTTNTHWDPEEMERLNARLDEINENLERMIR